MKILVTAPCVYPVVSPSLGGYGGMERLAALISTGLVEAGHSVTLVAARDSKLPGTGVEVLPSSDVGTFQESELTAWREHEWALDHTDVVLDLSHSHYFRVSDTPGISWIWHDPKMMEPPVPLNNVAALSAWQAERFMQTTGQNIRVIDCICADEKVCFYDPEIEVGNRYISIGIVDENKGQLQAAQLAQECDIGLDIVGKAVDMSIVTKLLDIERDTGGKVKYHGEVFGSMKMDVLKRSKGLIYTPSYPEGMGEAHSHKVVEALMSGVPCLLSDQGAVDEVFGQSNVEGPLAAVALDGDELREMLPHLGSNASAVAHKVISDEATVRWSVPAVTERLVGQLEAVAGGETW